mgnify:CR=1 FL=1
MLNVESHQVRLTLTPTSGSVSASGNNTLITPAANKRLRIYYVSYNPATPVEAAFRFGASGQLFLRNGIVTGGSIFTKDFGEFKNIQGQVGEPLILNLSGAVTTLWNCFYQEV